MKSPLLIVCPAIVLGLLAQVSVSHADPSLLNGSFEDPVLAPNSIQTGGGTSWTPNNSSVFIISNNFSNFGTTPFGNQYLGFDKPNAQDEQTVSGFVAGQDYLLDLWISDIANSSNPKLQVLITGAATAGGTFSASQTPSLSFLEVQLPFTAVSDGSITLDIIDAGSANLAVDNVSIAEAVPEPSTIFAMILVTGTVATGAARKFRATPR